MMARRRVTRKRMISAITAAVLCIAVFVIMYLSQTSSVEDIGGDYVRFFDVGQGDAALIYSNGYSALIDTGTSENSGTLCSDIAALGIKRIDVLLLSHLHTDHTGGTEDILDRFTVDTVILPEISVASEGLAAAELSVNRMKQTGGAVYNAAPGMNFKIGNFEVTVLGSYGEMNDENDRSVVAMAKLGERKFLFTGDAGTKTEAALIADGINLDCDVLKMGHHGSSTSSSDKFLNAATPDYAVISVGTGNSYGHPHRETVSKLNTRKIKYYRTDTCGDITFSIDNGIINIETENSVTK